MGAAVPQAFPETGPKVLDEVGGRAEGEPDFPGSRGVVELLRKAEDGEVVLELFLPAQEKPFQGWVRLHVRALQKHPVDIDPSLVVFQIPFLTNIVWMQLVAIPRAFYEKKLGSVSKTIEVEGDIL